MQINNVFASLPVKDLAVSRAWYETLFGRGPDSLPMPTLAEWRFGGGGSLQVYAGPDRAGGGSCTLAVNNIDAVIDGLKGLGIDPGKLIDGGKAKVVMLKDPDGNSIAFAQAMDASLALGRNFAMTPLQIVKKALQAYADKDRDAIESVIAEDYRFKSPLDNGLNRATYFSRCWPNSEHIEEMKFVEGAERGDTAWIVYEAKSSKKRFRNAEMHKTRDGKLVATEVYFGWDVPHPAANGGFIKEDQ